MQTIVLIRTASLGEGDRKAGETLGTFATDCTPEVLLAEALVTNDVAALPGNVVPSEGVVARELLTALRNPHLIAFGFPEGDQHDPEAGDDDTNPNGGDESPPSDSGDTKPANQSRRKPKRPSGTDNH